MKQQKRRPFIASEWTIFSMRVTKKMRAKIERLGGAKWIRGKIERAREPEVNSEMIEK